MSTSDFVKGHTSYCMSGLGLPHCRIDVYQNVSTNGNRRQ